MSTTEPLIHTNRVTEKGTGLEEKSRHDDDDYDDGKRCHGCGRVQIFCFGCNLILVVAVFIVSVAWSVARKTPLTDFEMSPAPGKDRSICVPPENGEGTCVRKLPEDYIEEVVEKKMRKLQMKYMAEKLNYANVVCRKSKPSVHLFHGVERVTGSKGNIRWVNNNQHHKANKSLTYNTETGQFEVEQDGLYFINSQITEKAQNLANNGTSLKIVIERNGRSYTLVESDSAPCFMIKAEAKKAHYVGSAHLLQTDDVLYVVHSHPVDVVNDKDTFIGIRKLW